MEPMNDWRLRLEETTLDPARKTTRNYYAVLFFLLAVTGWGVYAYSVQVRRGLDRDVLSTFYDFPAAHWVHLRTTNPIESTFATVKARTKVTKGAGTRRRGLVMAYKLLDAAQDRWRKANSPELVALIQTGIEFKNGIQTERRAEGSRDAA